MPTPGLTITATDRVLIHLKDHLHDPDDDDFPLAITQKGISDATGLRLTHVPRTLKGLEDRELVCSAKGHVREEARRYKVYFLTGKGLAEANVVLKRILSDRVDAGQGPKQVGEILGARKGPVLPRLRELAGESEETVQPECRIVGLIPGTAGFVGRERELAELGQMLLDARMRVMVIYGSVGYGTSALAAKFVNDHSRGWSAAWVEISHDLPNLLESISATIGEVAGGAGGEPFTPRRMAQVLDGKKLILVLDNYYDASEEVVEFLAGLVAASRPMKAFKLLVTAREDTPSYNRFYTIMDQHDGTVGEVHVRGLDIEHCRELLGTPDIDPDALQRLFLFTRGKPPTLKLLARGDEKELRQHTSFSPEEIKLMLFLKGQRKK